MLAAWATGWFLREGRGSHPRTGEACYLIGAGLWLTNIALLGQIYHLSSRPPNAFLLWLAGIAPTAWILRSKALFSLSLVAGVIWLGAELNTSDGLFGGEWESAQLAVYGLVGLLLGGWSWFLRTTRWSEFSSPAERLGLLMLLGAAYPLCWKAFPLEGPPASPAATALWILLGAGGITLLALGLMRTRADLPDQWRWTWGLTLTGLAALLALALMTSPPHSHMGGYASPTSHLHWLFSIALFVACLLQVQVGVLLRHPFLVNAALALIVLVLIATYISLFGTMATTGWMLLLSGLFLLAFGVYLERKRRHLLRQMQATPLPHS
jgi:uncharacterized membrane protein